MNINIKIPARRRRQAEDVDVHPAAFFAALCSGPWLSADGFILDFAASAILVGNNPFPHAANGLVLAGDLNEPLVSAPRESNAT